MNDMRFGVVVVAWKVKDAVLKCLACIRGTDYQGVEIVVVDNGSADGTTESIRQQFPEVKLLPQPRNLGFAKACNLGAAVTTADTLVFLNPDTEVEPDFFNKLELFLQKHTQVGVVGGRIINADGSMQSSVRSLPTFWPLLLDAMHVLKLAPWLAPKYLLPQFDYENSQRVDQVMGACFAVPRYVWQRLHGFDERFFVWFEEVDFCARAALVGYEVWYHHKLRLSHAQAQSARQVSLVRRHAIFTHSMYYYARLHLGPLQALVLRIAAAISYLGVAIAQMLLYAIS